MGDISDYQVFKESLLAAARGPFFPDGEFHPLFGLERADVESIANTFSPSTALAGDVALALNNAMNNLLGYPHQREAAWSEWLSVSPAQLEIVFVRWRVSGNGA